jgi:hypothetical protein
MKNRGWSILVLSSVSEKRNRQVRVPAFVIVLFILFFSAGFIGFARLAYVGISYEYVKFGLLQRKKENNDLAKKIQFLKKFSQSQEKRIEKLVAFEDMMRLKYGLNTISTDVRKAGVGGYPDVRQVALAAFEHPRINTADTIIGEINTMLRQMELQHSTLNRVADHVQRQYDHWAQRPTIWPVRGRLTSRFGYRVHPFTHQSLFHEGLDIANKKWTPIFATADGIVSNVDRRTYFGNVVMITHQGAGFKTVYAHLMQSAVVEGQFVKRGEVIGYLGDTGRSTGPHLHYEIRKNNRPVDPLDYILPTDTVVD